MAAPPLSAALVSELEGREKVGGRGGEAAKKYNLLQTVRLTASFAGGADVEAIEGVRAIVNSFELSAGTTCA